MRPLILTWVLLAVTAPAFAQDAGVGCETLTADALRNLPQLFYEGRPDSLLDTLDQWEWACGRREAITRTRILGAVWDGGFTEDLYGREIMDDLIERGSVFADSTRQPDARGTYDLFTVDLADQLLPHQQPVSLEAFFCLFYSGRTAAAWSLLEDAELQDSGLRYYRERELRLLEDPVLAARLAVTGGWWAPTGDLGFVGDRPSIGVMAEVSDNIWFARLVIEWRVGRADTRYWVRRDGLNYLTDRWDAVLLGTELGRRLVGGDRWWLEGFIGIGVERIKPLGSAQEWLSGTHGSLGCGVRYDLDEDRRWFAGLDLRSEFIGDRNADAVNLSGEAWSVRVVFGRNHPTRDHDRRDRLTN